MSDNVHTGSHNVGRRSYSWDEESDTSNDGISEYQQETVRNVKTYHEVLFELTRRIGQLELELLESTSNKEVSLKDSMLRMHRAWQTLLDNVRQTRLTANSNGQRDTSYVETAIYDLMSESALLIVELSGDLPVLTAMQAVNRSNG